jgi:hypothetical protein
MLEGPALSVTIGDTQSIYVLVGRSLRFTEKHVEGVGGAIK